MVIYGDIVKTYEWNLVDSANFLTGHSTSRREALSTTTTSKAISVSQLLLYAANIIILGETIPTSFQYRMGWSNTCANNKRCS